MAKTKAKYYHELRARISPEILGWLNVQKMANPASINALIGRALELARQAEPPYFQVKGHTPFYGLHYRDDFKVIQVYRTQDAAIEAGEKLAASMGLGPEAVIVEKSGAA